MSEPSSSKQAQQNGSTSDEPVNPGLPPAPAVQSDDDDDDKPVRKMTPTEKFKIIEGILEAPDDAKQIQEAVEKALPSDVILNFRQIQAAIHSDRFPDPVNKDKATRAFQKLGFLRDNVGAKSGQVDTANAFKFGNDPNRPQPHVEGKLSFYHEEAHQKATPDLQVLFKALVDNPSLNLDKTQTPVVRDAVSKLDKVNELIREHNAKNSKDSDLGIIRYSDLLAKWRPILLLDDDDTKKILRHSLLAYCKKMQYPDAWANQTPSSDPTSDQPGGVPESQSTSHVANVSQNQNTNSQFQNSTNTVVAPPLDVSRQQLYNGANTAAATAASPGNRITLQSVSGQKRVIALKPRKTHRAVQPGFTSSGEKILFIQSLGLNGNARFVVTDAEGNVRLVSASSAGGQPALDGAKRTGVPYTLQDPAKILELRDLVRCGGVYGLEFVAIGEWDMTNTRLPFIVVLFYHENEKGRREEAISRSSLTKILAKREAEKLVAESIVGDPEMSLKEALMSQVAPKKQEDLSNNVPPLLPYGQQSQPWWFQTTPQHHGSHAVFNAGPLQQPYSNQFQQFVPQQFQQPSIHQFQPGPFAMPPQPVLDSSMMKHGANSPAASMMEEEL